MESPVVNEVAASLGGEKLEVFRKLNLLEQHRVESYKSWPFPETASCSISKVSKSLRSLEYPNDNLYLHLYSMHHRWPRRDSIGRAPSGKTTPPLVLCAERPWMAGSPKMIRGRST